MVLFCSVLGVACAKKKNSPAPVVPACASKDISLSAAKEQRQDHMTLTRVFAYQKITACDGSQDTKHITIQDPKDAYSLAMKNPQPGEYEVFAYNRTTCDSGTIKPRAKTDTRMEIQMHTSPGTHRMQVEKNADNYIDYEFRRCLGKDASGNCVSSEVAESGTLILHIDYQEIEDPDLIEKTETCNKPN